MSATDPGIPDDDLEWPGHLMVEWPDCNEPEAGPKIAIGFPAEVRAEVRAARLRSGRGQTRTALLDKHRNLNRIRVAALLAVLDGPREASLEDWELAGTYWEVSGAVRDWMARYDADEEAKNEAGVRARLSGRAAHIKSEDEKREALLIRAVDRAIRHIRSDSCGGVHRRRCVTNYGLDSRLRKELKENNVTMDAVFARLITSGKVREAGGDVYKAAVGR
jgi:hypothetical protein